VFEKAKMFENHSLRPHLSSLIAFPSVRDILEQLVFFLLVFGGIVVCTQGLHLLGMHFKV
jgi:hypothetical protein